MPLLFNPELVIVMTQFTPIEIALEELRQGRMIILVDDENREQEGDLVIAADKVTGDVINFMTKNTSGLICLSLAEEIVDRLQIPLMPTRNRHKNQACFTVSIEAMKGVTTGASAHDRAETIRVAIDPASKPEDVSMPGHVFPLKAEQGGVLVRPGHTEGSVDLAKLAGFAPAAVISEVMNADGTMARLPDLIQFAEKHQIKIVAINDLIHYRFQTENLIEKIASAPLPIRQDPDFLIKAFKSKYDGEEHFALVHRELDVSQPVLVRVHSECLTGDAFGSLRCDCGWQLEESLQQIAKHKGILLYLPQEGRGIGLSNKIKAYQLQSAGLDTVDANHQLGFAADQRYYGMSAQILKFLGVKQIQLLTNNPRKIADLENFGIQIVKRIPHESSPNDQNIEYLKTKRDKLGHLLEKIGG